MSSISVLNIFLHTVAHPPGGRNIFAGVRQPPVIVLVQPVQPSGRHMRMLEDGLHHSRLPLLTESGASA
ncbi:MAG: hypothetical protein R3C28_21180 [Pirellulaceae bacterium]